MDDSENLKKEISTLESLYEAPLNMQKLERSQGKKSSRSTEYKNENSWNESIILDFLKLKPYGLQQVWKPHTFSMEPDVESKTEDQGRIVDIDWCQCGEFKIMVTYTKSLSGH